jgi:hypothetical protein
MFALVWLSAFVMVFLHFLSTSMWSMCACVLFVIVSRSLSVVVSICMLLVYQCVFLYSVLMIFSSLANVECTISSLFSSMGSVRLLLSFFFNHSVCSNHFFFCAASWIHRSCIEVSYVCVSPTFKLIEYFL